MFSVRQTHSSAPQDDFMDIDDAIETGHQRPSLPLLSAARNMNPFSLLDPNFRGSLLDERSDFMFREPIVSHPREVRQIPIEVKDDSEPSHHGPSEPSHHGPSIEDVTESTHLPASTNQGTVIVDEVDDDVPAATTAGWNDSSQEGRINPSAPTFDSMPDNNNDIEEEMIRAAIEASKRETEVHICGN